MDDQQRARELALPPLPPMGYEARGTGMGMNDVYYTPVAYTAEQMQDYARAALRAAPEGFVMVPEVMDIDMEVAFCEAWFSKRRCIDDADMQDAWAAALAARPQGVK